MPIFLDESFRDSHRDAGVSLGALCGIGIPEKDLSQVATDIYALKYKHLGADFAREREIKGRDLFKSYVFRLAERRLPSLNLELGADIINYIVGKRLPVFGCVCFEKKPQKFHATDVSMLDESFRFLFERIDAYMKRARPGDLACLVFDDRGYGINAQNSEAITKFFQRDASGLWMDSIVRTPFFAISQAHNIGLQLADLVTTVIGLRFSSNREIAPYYAQLRKAIPLLNAARGRMRVTGLKVMRGGEGEKESARRPFGPRSGQASPTTRRWTI